MNCLPVFGHVCKAILTRPSSQLLLYLSKSSLPANPPQQLPQPANQDHSFECLKASDMAAEDVMDFF